ncbi:MgtC/SapB family protein, partial [bacterium M00.F.Ca.ET.205.01.1.1]
MDTLIARRGLALAIGLLVGLERGWRERHAPDRSRTAGIRTFGISGLLGGIVTALANALGA